MQAKLEGQRAFLQAAQELIVSAPGEFGCFRIGNDDRGQERVFCKTCEAHSSLPSRAARGAFVTGAIKCFSQSNVKQRQTVRNPSPSSQACCCYPLTLLLYRPVASPGTNSGCTLVLLKTRRPDPIDY